MEQKFKVLENSPDGVVVVNSIGKIVHWNKVLKEITGICEKDVIDKNFWDVQEDLFFTENQKEFSKEKLKFFLKNEGIKNLINHTNRPFKEFFLKRPDESFIKIEQTFYLYEEEGADFYVISFIRDISEREKNREAHRNYMNILNHDMRGPLSSILGISNLLLEEDLSKEDSKELLEILELTTNKALKMMESYLLLEKIERGQGNLNKVIKSVIEVTNEIKECFNSKNSGSKFSVVFRNNENPKFNFSISQKKISIDEIIFTPLINNLINNALEASKGNIIVNVFENNEKLCISFSNEGEVPPEIQKKLFTKFSTSKKNGTGLGLYSSRLIARAHGGDLVYESLEGGTRFIIEIPFC